MKQFAILDTKTLFEVKGPEAEKFLQGQLSCDVSKLAIGESCHGVFCSPQGRMHGNFIIYRRDAEGYLFQLEKSIAENFTKQLGKYIVFSKAEIANIDHCMTLELLSETASSESKAIIDKLAHAYNVSTPDNDSQIWLTGNSDADRHLLFSQLSAAGFEQVNESQVCAKEIERGQAWVTDLTAEEYLPQMLNLDLRGAVSFDKGCYTGQEVVARAHYRGQVKRRLYYGAAANIEQLPEINSPLFNNENKQVGNVINATVHNGALKLLFVLNKEDYLSSDIFVETESGRSVIQPRQLTKSEAG